MVLKFCFFCNVPVPNLGFLSIEYLAAHEEWKDCIAVEMINNPVLGDAPPASAQLVHAEVTPMRLQRVMTACDIMQLHVYKDVL